MVSSLDLNAAIFAELKRRANLFLQGVSASNFRCIKLNPLSLLFQLARYHRNNTNKRLQTNRFRTFQRNHCLQ